MAEYLIQDSTLDAIVEAINQKAGTQSAMTPAQMVTAIGNIPSGTTITDGIVVTDFYNDGTIKEADFYGTIIRKGELAYMGYINSAPVTVNFMNNPTFLKEQALAKAFIVPVVSGLASVTDCESNAFSFVCTATYSFASETLNLPSFTGAGNSGSRFRGANTAADAYWYGTVQLPVIQKINDYDFYQTRVSDAVFQLGSIGHAVTSCGNRPFGGSTGSGTITVYTTGALLDTIKTAIQNSAGSSYTFIYKASEATTYGGNSYAAGDTMLTVGGA